MFVASKNKLFFSHVAVECSSTTAQSILIFIVATGIPTLVKDKRGRN